MKIVFDKKRMGVNFQRYFHVNAFLNYRILQFIILITTVKISEQSKQHWSSLRFFHNFECYFLNENIEANLNLTLSACYIEMVISNPDEIFRIMWSLIGAFWVD